MVKFTTNIAKLSVLAAMLSSVAFAGVQAPLGNLSGGDNITISGATGSFPVSGDYAYNAGEIINTRDGAVASLALDNGGHFYVSPNSAAALKQTGSEIVADLSKGSVGFSFPAGSALTIRAGSSVITASGSDQKRAGAVAIGADGKLVVRSYGAELLITAEDGVTTPVEAGQSIALNQSQAKLLTTAVEDQQCNDDNEDTSDDCDKGIMWLLGGLAVVALISSDSDSSDSADADSATGAGGSGGAGASSSSGNGLPPGVTFIDANGVAHTGIDGGSKSYNYLGIKGCSSAASFKAGFCSVKPTTAAAGGPSASPSS